MSSSHHEITGAIPDTDLKYHIALRASPHPLEKDKLLVLPFASIQTTKENQAPLHNVIIADVSGSMGYAFQGTQHSNVPEAATRLYQVKQGYTSLIDASPDGSTFTLFAFDDQVKMIGTRASSKKDARENIKKLKLGGSTDIRKALLQSITPKTIPFNEFNTTKIYFVTDGCDSDWETSPQLMEIVRTLLEDVKKNYQGAPGVSDYKIIAIPITGVGVGSAYKWELFSGLDKVICGKHYHFKTPKHIEEFVTAETKNATRTHSVTMDLTLGELKKRNEVIPGGLKDNGEDKNSLYFECPISALTAGPDKKKISYDLSFSIGDLKSPVTLKSSLDLSADLPRDRLVESVFYPQKTQAIVEDRKSSNKEKVDELQSLLASFPKDPVPPGTPDLLAPSKKAIEGFITSYTLKLEGEKKSQSSAPAQTTEQELETRAELSALLSGTNWFQKMREGAQYRTNWQKDFLSAIISDQFSYNKNTKTFTIKGPQKHPGEYLNLSSSCEIVALVRDKKPIVYPDAGLAIRPAPLITKTYYTETLPNLIKESKLNEKVYKNDIDLLSDIANFIHTNYPSSTLPDFKTEYPSDYDQAVASISSEAGPTSDFLSKGNRRHQKIIDLKDPEPLTLEEKLISIPRLKKGIPFNHYLLAEFIEKKQFQCPEHALVVSTMMAHFILDTNKKLGKGNKHNDVYVYRGTAYNNKAHAWVMYYTDKNIYLIDSTMPGKKKCFDLKKENDANEALRAYEARGLHGVLEEAFDKINKDLQLPHLQHPESCHITDDEAALVPNYLDFDEEQKKIEEAEAKEQEKQKEKKSTESKEGPKKKKRTINLTCPITLEWMKEPVILEIPGVKDGDPPISTHTFEKSALLDHFESSDIHPMTGLKVKKPLIIKPDTEAVRMTRSIIRKHIPIQPEEATTILGPTSPIKKDRPLPFQRFLQALLLLSSDEKGRDLGNTLHKQVNVYLKQQKKSMREARKYSSKYLACQALFERLTLCPGKKFEVTIEQLDQTFKDKKINFKFAAFPKDIRENIQQYLSHFKGTLVPAHQTTTEHGHSDRQAAIAKLEAEIREKEKIPDGKATKPAITVSSNSPSPFALETPTGKADASPSSSPAGPTKKEESPTSVSESSSEPSLETETSFTIIPDGSPEEKQSPIEIFNTKYNAHLKNTLGGKSGYVKDTDRQNCEKVYSHALEPTFFHCKNRTRKIVEQYDTFRSLVDLKMKKKGETHSVSVTAEAWLQEFNERYIKKYGVGFCNTWYKRSKLTAKDRQNVTKILLHGASDNNRGREVLIEMEAIDATNPKKISFKIT